MACRAAVGLAFAGCLVACASEPSSPSRGSGTTSTDAQTEGADTTGAEATGDGPGSNDGSNNGSSNGSSNGSATDQASSTTAAGSSTGEDTLCDAPPDPSPAWMAAYQDEIVARLSGAMALPSGETLATRATVSARAEAADFLFDELTAFGLDPEVHEYDVDAQNVYALVPAAGPDPAAPETYLVVGAHYDTVPGSPGANDNATGVAMVLSLARYLGSLPCRDVGVIIVLFDQEEIGLVGSDAFAGLLVDQGLDIVAAHTIDQMGWDADGDRVVEIERADPGLLAFYEDALGPGPTPPLQPTQTGATDHVSFRAWGIDAVGLTEEFVGGDTTPHYHLPTDTYATVDFDFLASGTSLLHAAFARGIAP